MTSVPPLAAAPPPVARERVLTAPLVVFLVLVALALSPAAARWLARPSVPELVLELADGDLDGHERAPALRRLIALADDDADAVGTWAALLAAIVLPDRAAHDRIVARTGGELPALPAPPARTDLHLGDPMLGNVLAATAAERDGHRDEARRLWAVVDAQSRLAGREFARELAAAALARLPAR